MSSRGQLTVLSAIVRHFQNALSKAKRVKTKASVEPPLPSEEFRSDILEIGETDVPEDSGVVVSRSMAIEAAARSILFDKVAVSELHDNEFVEVWNLLDIVQFCADSGLCEAGLTLWLIEELLDGQTIDGCRGVFDYLESRTERLVGTELTQNKRNTILRTCNELLHRLSRAEDAVFCGRVFIFLFKIFPLGDKSAVNLRGEFHVENNTVFDANAVYTQEAPENRNASPTARNDITEKGEDDDKHNTVSSVRTSLTVPNSREMGQDSSKRIDGAGIQNNTSTVDSDKLYPIFWSLQHVFSNPPRVFHDGELAQFKTGLELTLAKFNDVPKVPTAPTNHARGTKRKFDEREDGGLASTFNPKYLTSKDLFKLEMSDITFQRHILVQALIMLDFLLSLTSQAKRKNEDANPQKAMQYGFDLSSEDAKWANGMRRQIVDYLKHDQEGQLYQRMVETVLSRDKNWVWWKMASCPPMSKPPVSPNDFTKAREDIKRAFTSRRMRARIMGSIDLGFLADQQDMDNMNSLRESERFKAPDLTVALSDVSAVQLDLEMVAEDAAERATILSKRSSKTWRALRLASKTRLAAFPSVDEASGNLDCLNEPGGGGSERPAVEDRAENDGLPPTEQNVLTAASVDSKTADIPN